jgi:uncharacterized protein YjbI with pentapeptide repeats
MQAISPRRARKVLIERWDPSFPANLDGAPFGYTDEGYKDFRGLPYVKYEKIYCSGFFKLDLSYADFSGVSLKNLEFIDCRFTGANFSDIYEAHCSFFGCVYKKCSFKKAIVGIRTSRYEDCVFEECDFRAADFSNAVYRKTLFLNNRFGNSHMNATGFWDCKFLGVLYGVTFHGDYMYESEYERFGRPNDTGLHNVDFMDAHLQMVGFDDHCGLENITLPKDGSSCLIDAKALIGDLQHLIEAFPEHAKGIRSYAKIFLGHPERQSVSICSLYDVRDLVENHNAGTAIYEEIKARHGVRAV